MSYLDYLWHGMQMRAALSVKPERAEALSLPSERASGATGTGTGPGALPSPPPPAAPGPRRPLEGESEGLRGAEEGSPAPGGLGRGGPVLSAAPPSPPAWG